MPANSKATPDAVFIEAWERGSASPQRVAELLGINIRHIYKRRADMANRGIILQTNPQTTGRGSQYGWQTDVGRAYKRQNDLRL